MRKVFVDTSAWIGFVVERDPCHQQAEGFFRALIEEGGKVFTSNYVIDETLTRLLYDRGLKVAREFYRWIKKAADEGRLAIFWIDEPITEQAWKAFIKFAEHKLSFTDATSYALMKRYRLDEIFAFDNDFAKIGLNLRP
jgi:predicted nucleic acid-binding protein